MRRALRKLMGMLAGAVAGLVLLDLFCTLYYNPAGYVRDEARATDVVREPGRFTARASEGVNWAVVDENGYNNREVPQEIYVLMMGSSHAEGFYVPPGEDVSAQLQELLNGSGVDGAVYNIGISGHHLPRNVMNLERALARFQPRGYVVLETHEVMLYPSEIEAAMGDFLARVPGTEVVINRWLSERPLLRTLYRQIMALREADPEAELETGGDEAAAAAALELTPEILRQYKEMLCEMFARVRAAADDYGVTPIVYYHPQLVLQEDGSARTSAEPELLRVFGEACAEEGVIFLDLSERFLDAYAAEGALPHGFLNTAPGAGHLNARGARMAAEAICEEIVRREAEK